MVVQGRVENGIVLLPPNNPFVEGQSVTITASPQALRTTHSILDIPTFSIGHIQDDFTNDDDTLGEMLASI